MAILIKQPSISIITATYNADEYLPNLIKSLKNQTDKDFEWVVADGLSADNTLNLISEIKDFNVVMSSEPDFGIYDALNRAIKLSSGEFYVVIGADDELNVDAVKNFRLHATSNFSVVTASIFIENKVHKTSILPMFISGFRKKITGHSVATAFRKSLHSKYGYYSKKYPIAADYEFMMKLILNNEPIKQVDFIAGSFALGGLSSQDRLGTASEVMRVMVSFGYSTIIQIAIFIFRLRSRKFFSLKFG